MRKQAFDFVVTDWHGLDKWHIINNGTATAIIINKESRVGFKLLRLYPYVKSKYWLMQVINFWWLRLMVFLKIIR